MRLHQLCTTIRERHKNGETYQAIADSFGVTRSMAWKIAHGYKPGKNVRDILKLDPESGLVGTRNRRKTLDRIAQEWGFANWCALETDTIHRQG